MTNCFSPVNPARRSQNMVNLPFLCIALADTPSGKRRPGYDDTQGVSDPADG
jgi:hypothetical protein